MCVYEDNLKKSFLSLHTWVLDQSHVFIFGNTYLDQSYLTGSLNPILRRLYFSNGLPVFKLGEHTNEA